MTRRNTLLEENSGTPAQTVHILDHSPHFPPLRCQACPPGGCQRAVPAMTPHHTRRSTGQPIRAISVLHARNPAVARVSYSSSWVAMEADNSRTSAEARSVRVSS